MRTVSHWPDGPLTFSPYTQKDPAMRRFLFYSHDGLGLGHVRRNLAIAHALTEVSADASVLVLTGAAEAASLGVPPRVSIAKLPGPHRSDQKVLAAAVEKGTPMRQPLSLDPSSESLARPCFPACCRFRWKPQCLTRVHPLPAERDFMSVLLSQ